MHSGAYGERCLHGHVITAYRGRFLGRGALPPPPTKHNSSLLLPGSDGSRGEACPAGSRGRHSRGRGVQAPSATLAEGADGPWDVAGADVSSAAQEALGAAAVAEGVGAGGGAAAAESRNACNRCGVGGSSDCSSSRECGLKCEARRPLVAAAVAPRLWGDESCPAATLPPPLPLPTTSKPSISCCSALHPST